MPLGSATSILIPRHPRMIYPPRLLYQEGRIPTTRGVIVEVAVVVEVRVVVREVEVGTEVLARVPLGELCCPNLVQGIYENSSERKLLGPGREREIQVGKANREWELKN